jgi:hypothetical protein
MVDSLESGTSWRDTLADIENQVRDRETMPQKEDYFEQIGGGDKHQRTNMYYLDGVLTQPISSTFESLTSTVKMIQRSIWKILNAASSQMQAKH